MDLFRKEINGSDVIKVLVRDSEMESFPHDVLAKEYPQVVEERRIISETQNVLHEWVMFAKLGMVSILTPTAVLHPIKSINVYSVARFFSLHPGARNTSNLLGLYQTIFDNFWVSCKVGPWNIAHAFGKQNMELDVSCEIKRQPVWSNSYTEGQLDRTQLGLMARPQNRGWSCEFQAEGKTICSWVHQDGHINEAHCDGTSRAVQLEKDNHQW